MAGPPPSPSHGRTDRVLLLGMGDTHGDFGPLFEVARREPAARAILQVGDLTAGKAGRDREPDDDPATLGALPVPLVWVHGNHEHWHVLGYPEGAQRDAPGGAPEGARSDGTGRAPRTATGVSGRPPSIGHHLWPGDEYVVPGTNIRVVGLPGNFAPTWYQQTKPFP